MSVEPVMEEGAAPVELDVVFEELRKAEERVAEARRKAEEILKRAREEAERILREGEEDTEEPGSADAGAELAELEREVAARLERVKRALEERADELREMALIALLEWW